MAGTSADAWKVANQCGRAAYYVDASVNNVKIRLLVDTGSTISIVSGNFWERHLALAKTKLQQGAQAVAAGNQPLRVKGTAMVKVRVGSAASYIRIYVVDDLGCDGFLGRDFLELNQVDIRASRAVLTIGEEEVPLHRTPEATAVRMVLKGDIKIPPGGQLLVPAKVRLPEGSPASVSGMMLRLRETQKTMGIRLASSTGKSSQGLVPVCLLNLTNRPKKVNKNTCVGLFQPVQFLEDREEEEALEANLVDVLGGEGRPQALQVGGKGHPMPCRLEQIKITDIPPEEWLQVYYMTPDPESPEPASSEPGPLEKKKQTKHPMVYNVWTTPQWQWTEEDLAEIQKQLEEKGGPALQDLKKQYPNIFPTDKKELGRTSELPVQIPIAEGRQPRRLPARRVPLHSKPKLQEEIESLLRRGLISPSRSPWASPIVLVEKKDGSTRFCVDYRELNAATIKDSYPIPRTDEALDTLAGACIFTTLDLAAGYWQQEMHPDDRHKTAFATPGGGLYEWNVMPFGLCNAPAAFQRLMDLVLTGLNWRTCLVYIDDIIVFSSTIEEHKQRLGEVFKRIDSAGLKLNLSKCHFFKEKVEYLGHVVSARGVEPRTEKIQAVQEFPVPKNAKELSRFIGLANYYRRFIPRFADVAAPLYDAMKAKTLFSWTETCQAAFEELKNRLTTAPVLAFPRMDLPFIVETDASDIGVGAILSQKYEDGSIHVIAYSSSALRAQKKSWITAEKEAFAIISAVREFRPYLYHSKFTIITDHEPIKWMDDLNCPPHKIYRWILELQEYEYEIIHRPGRIHSHADALSRAPRPEDSENKKGHQTNEEDNGDFSERLLPPKSSDPKENKAGKEEAAGSDATPAKCCMIEMESRMEEFRQKQLEDGIVGDALRRIEGGQVDPPPPDPNPVAGNPDFPRPREQLEKLCLRRVWSRLAVRGGVLCRNWICPMKEKERKVQIVLPKGDLRAEMLYRCHDDPAAAHDGIERTYTRLHDRFYWPLMRRDVEEYVQQCVKCATGKPTLHWERAKLQPIESSRRWELITMDFLGPFLVTDTGWEYALIMTDHFTKWPEVYLTSDLTAATVAYKIIDFTTKYGTPERILADQGTQFESKLLKELCELKGIKKVRTSPYHPQTDGQTERFNRTLTTKLRMYVAENQKDWDRYVPEALESYRSAVHETTGKTPYEMVFGSKMETAIDREIKIPPQPGDPPKQPTTPKDLKEMIDRVAEAAKPKTKKEKARHKRLADRKAKAEKYEPGDRVMLYTRKVEPGKSAKLTHFWGGPHEVLERIDGIDYRIKSEEDGRIQVVHRNRLSRYTGSKRERQQQKQAKKRAVGGASRPAATADKEKRTPAIIPAPAPQPMALLPQALPPPRAPPARIPQAQAPESPQSVHPQAPETPQPPQPPQPQSPETPGARSPEGGGSGVEGISPQRPEPQQAPPRQPIEAQSAQPPVAIPERVIEMRPGGLRVQWVPPRDFGALRGIGCGMGRGVAASDEQIAGPSRPLEHQYAAAPGERLSAPPIADNAPSTKTPAPQAEIAPPASAEQRVATPPAERRDVTPPAKQSVDVPVAEALDKGRGHESSEAPQPAPGSGAAARDSGPVADQGPGPSAPEASDSGRPRRQTRPPDRFGEYVEYGSRGLAPSRGGRV